MNGVILYGENKNETENYTKFSSSMWETLQFIYGGCVGLYNIDINITTTNFTPQSTMKCVIDYKVMPYCFTMDSCNILVNNQNNNSSIGGGTSSNHLKIVGLDGRPYNNYPAETNKHNVYITNCNFTVGNKLQYIDIFAMIHDSTQYYDSNFYCYNNKFNTSISSAYLFYDGLAMPYDATDKKLNAYFIDNDVDLIINFYPATYTADNLYPRFINNHFRKNFIVPDNVWLFAKDNTFEGKVDIYNQGIEGYIFLNNYCTGTSCVFSDSQKSYICYNTFLKSKPVNNDSSNSSTSFNNTKQMYNVFD